ncbi:restriction endonuclease subunit S [Polaribacter atrinae]|uniref:Type I restriction modification DNA specificity domain-containing protein n=1 Tax=Polaribacter atrinae TaxID=1333662 RepID=A0A176TDH7_9FLAO|nr:restriction endonuclease subunit S [Polaribacter atrinae]OAD45920.1 hypothetical protein LPB303_06430 [Polaribacter atrinae]
MGKFIEIAFSEICDFENGDRGKNYPSRSAYIDIGIPFFSAGNISDNKINKSSLNYISKERFDLLGSGKVRKGDILFCLRGSLGKFAEIEDDIDGGIASSLVIIRPSDKVNLGFLKLFLESHLCSELIKKYDNGTAQPNLSAASLKKFKIPLPPLPEQQRIVAKLDGLFAKIDKAISLLEANILHTQALMGSVLDEEFGRLEETSKVVSISEIADVKGGKRLPKGQKLLEFKTDYPYIRVTDFSENGTIEIDKLKFISKEIHEQISRYIITNDDLYISIAGTIGKTGIIPKQLNGANLTENAARLVYKDKSTIDNAFVYYYTKSDKFKRFVEDSTKQVAQPKLALTRLKQIKLALPSLKKQQKVVEKFKHAEERLIALEETQTEKLNHLKALKSSLLDQAFKGEL